MFNFFNLFKKQIKSVKESIKSDLELFLEKTLTEETVKTSKIKHNTISGYVFDYAVKMKIVVKSKKDTIKIEISYNSIRKEFGSIIVDVNNTLNVFYIMNYDYGHNNVIDLLDSHFNIKQIAKGYVRKRDEYNTSQEAISKREKNLKERKENEKVKESIINRIIG